VRWQGGSGRELGRRLESSLQLAFAVKGSSFWRVAERPHDDETLISRGGASWLQEGRHWLEVDEGEGEGEDEDEGEDGSGRLEDAATGGVGALRGQWEVAGGPSGARGHA
jgi:hypothetical protein